SARRGIICQTGKNFKRIFNQTHMSDWEATFTSWAAGPGTTEQTRAENAEKGVKKAIAANAKLAQMDITVFPHGSYRNRTNVRQDSDVDICVRLNSTFFTEYPAGKTD